jgi:hypothetical protein
MSMKMAIVTARVQLERERQKLELEQQIFELEKQNALMQAGQGKRNTELHNMLASVFLHHRVD